MDAVKFAKEYRRMCDSFETCGGCPVFEVKGRSGTGCNIWAIKFPEQSVPIVEKWSSENPVKTFMDDFFEKLPNAPRHDNGQPTICPWYCGYTNENNCPAYDSSRAMTCLECWSRPLGGITNDTTGTNQEDA